MKAGWRDAPLALRDSVVSNMHEKKGTSSREKLAWFPHNLDLANV